LPKSRAALSTLKKGHGKLKGGKGVPVRQRKKTGRFLRGKWGPLKGNKRQGNRKNARATETKKGILLKRSHFANGSSKESLKEEPH